MKAREFIRRTYGDINKGIARRSLLSTRKRAWKTLFSGISVSTVVRPMKSKLLPIKPYAWPTAKLRFVLRRSPRNLIRLHNILQQWWWDGLRGEWRDVAHRL